MDFSLCLADPNKSTFVNDFEALHEDFKKGTVKTTVPIRSLYTYIVSTYDKESPFVIKYTDWTQRRKATAKFSLLLIDSKTKKYTRESEEIILGTNREVTSLVVIYLSLQNDVDFINLAGYQALYAKQIKAAFSTEYDNPLSYEKLQKNINQLSEDIKSLQKIIFRGDETNEYRMRLYEFTNRLSLDITPEEIAVKKEKEEPVVDNPPYGEEYKIGKLRYIGDE